MKPYERRREPGPVTRFLLGALLVFVSMVYGLMAVILPPQMLSYPATPLLIMIGLILWLLPDVGGIYYDRLQQLMIAYMGINIAWPSYIALNLPGLPWVSLTRLVLFMVLALFIWNFSTSQQLRDKLRDAVSETPITIRMFWMFWATTTISLVFAQPIGAAISKYINNQIYWTMVLFVTALLATRPGFVGKFVRVLLIATAIVIVYSIYEFRIQRVPWIDYLPSFLKIDPELLEILMDSQSRAGTDIYRVRGPFAASLFFSEFLTMVFPFFLYFTIKERRVIPFLALVAAAFGCLVVMYLTNARSAILGALVAFVLYPFFYAIRRQSQAERSIVGTSLLMAYPAILAVASALVLFWPRAHTMILGGGQHQASSDARSEQWRMGIPKLLSHPLGYGVGRGNEALGFVNPAGKGTVDTYYLTVMLDFGILALPLFLLTFLIPAWLAFKYYRDAKTPEQEVLAPLSIAIINFIIVKSVLTSEANIPLAFAYVGCIIGLIWQRHRLPEACGEAPAAPALPPDGLARAGAGPPVLAAPRSATAPIAVPAPGYRR
jgi:O-Antigen ligase